MQVARVVQLIVQVLRRLKRRVSERKGRLKLQAAGRLTKVSHSFSRETCSRHPTDHLFDVHRSERMAALLADIKRLSCQVAPVAIVEHVAHRVQVGAIAELVQAHDLDELAGHKAQDAVANLMALSAEQVSLGRNILCADRGSFCGNNFFS